VATFVVAFTTTRTGAADDVFVRGLFLGCREDFSGFAEKLGGDNDGLVVGDIDPVAFEVDLNVHASSIAARVDLSSTLDEKSSGEPFFLCSEGFAKFFVVGVRVVLVQRFKRVPRSLGHSFVERSRLGLTGLTSRTTSSAVALGCGDGPLEHVYEDGPHEARTLLMVALFADSLDLASLNHGQKLVGYRVADLEGVGELAGRLTTAALAAEAKLGLHALVGDNNPLGVVVTYAMAVTARAFSFDCGIRHDLVTDGEDASGGAAVVHSATITAITASSSAFYASLD
jgi:hypothetical protein